MRIHCGHCCALMLWKADGSPLGTYAVQCDWEPAWQWTVLQGIRRAALPSAETSVRISVEPSWDPQHGQPLAAALGVTVTADGMSHSQDFGPSHFAGLAREISGRLIAAGTLTEGEPVHFALAALPLKAQAPDAAATRLAVEELLPGLALRETSLEALLEGAEATGDISPADVPVALARRVIDEAVGLTREAGSHETGGVLIGHVHRDRARAELALEVTAQVPALHTRSGLTQLVFTPETWSAARDAIAQRGANEIPLGWWHSHSFMKETCAKDRPGECQTDALFFSQDDAALHRACFPRAHCIALVISDAPCTGATWGLFGWREGLIVRRGFHMVGHTPDKRPQSVPAMQGGDTHDQPL